MNFHGLQQTTMVGESDPPWVFDFLADHPSGSLDTFAPTLSMFTQSILNLLEIDNPNLRRHFPGHPMACTTFNLGPRTITFPHKDLKNLSWGLCSVTSFGSYNPTKGGHLVLWDLGIAVEFPAYSTILFPSAVILHSNTSIGEDETRLTITQYSSAGLFGWKAYGYMPKGVSTQVDAWWEHPRHMFSKVHQLLGRISIRL